MELTAAFFEKFYITLHKILYKRQNGKEPVWKSGKLDSSIWTEKLPIEGNEIYLANYYFDVRTKYYYELYLEAIKGNNVRIDNLPYFKALLFVGTGKEKYPALDYLNLFKANKKRNKHEADKFLEHYDQNKLEHLHCLFAQENLPNDYSDEIIDRQRRKPPIIRHLDNSILEILDKKEEELYSYTINRQEKDILYEFFFNLSKPTNIRGKIVKVFSIHKILSDEEISNLILNGPIDTSILLITQLPNLLSDQNNKAKVYGIALDVAIFKRLPDLLEYLIPKMPDLLKDDWLETLSTLMRGFAFIKSTQPHYVDDLEKASAILTLDTIGKFFLDEKEVTLSNKEKDHLGALIFIIWRVSAENESVETVERVFILLTYLLLNRGSIYAYLYAGIIFELPGPSSFEDIEYLDVDTPYSDDLMRAFSEMIKSIKVERKLIIRHLKIRHK